MTSLGYAVRFNMPEPVIRAAAGAAEAAGLDALWVNNPPGQDGLTPMSWAAEVSAVIHLGTGVVPVSHHAPEDIWQQVLRLGLPLGRYRLGVGSGPGEHPRDRVREALRALRAQGSCELVVGALGPLMCALAGEEADAVLLNAVPPAEALRSAELARAGAEAAGRPAPRVYTSVQIGIGDAGQARLDQVAAFYAQLPQYVAHFQRTGTRPEEVLVAARDTAELADQLAAWRGLVDELVVGAVPAPDRPEEAERWIETIREAWRASAS